MILSTLQSLLRLKITDPLMMDAIVNLLNEVSFSMSKSA